MYRCKKAISVKSMRIQWNYITISLPLNTTTRSAVASINDDGLHLLQKPTQHCRQSSWSDWTQTTLQIFTCMPNGWSPFIAMGLVYVQLCYIELHYMDWTLTATTKNGHGENLDGWNRHGRIDDNIMNAKDGGKTPHYFKHWHCR